MGYIGSGYIGESKIGEADPVAPPPGGFLVDWETGDDSQLDYSTGGLSIVTDQAYDGTHSLVFGGADRYGYKSFDATNDKRIKFRLYISGTATFPSDYDAVPILAISVGEDIYATRYGFWLRRFSSDYINTFRILKSDFSVYEEGSDGLVYNEWMDCELAVVSHDGNGYVELVVNSTTVLSATGLSNPDESFISCFIGNMGSVGFEGGGVYIDAITDDLGGGPANYTLTAETVSMPITGYNTGIIAARLLTANTASLTLTGYAAGLNAGRRLIADTSAITLTGYNTGLRASRLLTAASASLSITGYNTGLIAARLLTAAAGTLTITGYDSGLLRGFTLFAETDVLTLTGYDAGLIAARILSAETSSLPITDYDADILSARLLTADTDILTITGYDAELIYGMLTGYSVSLSNGVFTDAYNFEFDVDINSSSLTLAAYQVVIGFDQSVTNNGTLSMEYIADSSEFTSIPPTAAVAVVNADGPDELAFGSGVGSESITTQKRIGRFRVTNTDPFIVQNPLLAFNFEGLASTILLNSSFEDITDSDNFDNTLLFDFIYGIEEGSLPVTGYDAALLYGRLLICETETFTLTGYDVQFLIGIVYYFVCETGSLTINGHDATLLVDRLLSAEHTGLTIAGYDVEFLLGILTHYILECDPAYLTLNTFPVRFLNYDLKSVSQSTLSAVLTGNNPLIDIYFDEKAGRLANNNPLTSVNQDKRKGIVEVLK